MTERPRPIQFVASDARIAKASCGTRHLPCMFPGGNINLNILTIAALIAFILIAVAFVLRAPLANVTAGHRARIEYQTLQRRQDNQRRALEQAIARELPGAAAGLERLTASVTSLEWQVQAAIGVPLESAVAHPPTAVRRAFLASSSFRTAWTELANAVLGPTQLDDLAAALRGIAARLSQHSVRDSDRQELAHIVTSIQTLQNRIDALDLSFLHTNQALDSQHSVTTIQNSERR